MRPRGKVLDWRGSFGFIRPLSGGDSVFVHQSDLLMEDYRELSKGDVVEFDYFLSYRGIKAVRVEVIQPAESAA